MTSITTVFVQGDLRSEFGDRRDAESTQEAVDAARHHGWRAGVRIGGEWTRCSPERAMYLVTTHVASLGWVRYQDASREGTDSGWWMVLCNY